MQITLLHNTPLDLADKAITKCWNKKARNSKERTYRVGIKNKHSSTLEHVSYTFDIDGISRACLQELARHRHTSMTVKSTRYTLKELKKAYNPLDYLVMTGVPAIDSNNILHLARLSEMLVGGLSNDRVKYMLPEAYKTSLVWTINMRSLQNFLSLRTDKAALWEIRELANNIFEALPDEHKYMLKDFVKEQDDKENNSS